MIVTVRVEALDVRSRLAELGLEEEPLREVVQRGFYAFTTCTPNHPPLIPGIWAWGETVRALREYVLRIGWSRSDEKNYSVVINPEGQIAIAVSTGDDATGRADATPSTKARKGPSTIDAVNVNQLQLNLFPPTPIPTPPRDLSQKDERVTWFLLMRRSLKEVRCELSLPSSIDADGHIDGWVERILLKPVPLDGKMIEITPPKGPEIIVNVRRKHE